MPRVDHRRSVVQKNTTFGSGLCGGFALDGLNGLRSSGLNGLRCTRNEIQAGTAPRNQTQASLLIHDAWTNGDHLLRLYEVDQFFNSDNELCIAKRMCQRPVSSCTGPPEPCCSRANLFVHQSVEQLISIPGQSNMFRCCEFDTTITRGQASRCCPSSVHR